MGKLATAAVLIMTLMGCASGHCLGTKAEKKIKIYKPDGSLQCTGGKVTSLEAMAKELGDIKIYSQENKSDGMMHVMMCGTPTGRVNVYEINEADFSKVSGLGFKKFSDVEKDLKN